MASFAFQFIFLSNITRGAIPNQPKGSKLESIVISSQICFLVNVAENNNLIDF